MNLSSSLRMADRILIYMAKQESGKFILGSDIAKALGFPKDYLSKILGQLVKNQILLAAKGKWGGYSLAKSPTEITLLDVHEAIEGKIQVPNCKVDKIACDFKTDDCPILKAYADVFDFYRNKLANIKINDLTAARGVEDSSSMNHNIN